MTKEQWRQVSDLPRLILLNPTQASKVIPNNIRAKNKHTSMTTRDEIDRFLTVTNL